LATASVTARNPVTYGDVRANFQAVDTGGAVIRSKKGFETTIPPAQGLRHSIRPIQPFFHNLRYCELDWHLITIATVIPEGLFGWSTEEVKAVIKDGVTEFTVAGISTEDIETTPGVKPVPQTDPREWWHAEGVFYAPGVLPVGSHDLSAVTRYSDGFEFFHDDITFHIDAAGTGACL
jgi:hypothetical protein